MPIRPENKKKYPKYWDWLSFGIRVGRAKNRCEGSPKYPNCRTKNHKPHPITKSKVTLTVAHLDHNPKNNNPKNLRAWCERCHNSYDNTHRIKGMKRRKMQNNKKMIKQGYPEKKTTELNKNETKAIRNDIRNGETDVYILATKYGCSTSQIAGIKGGMSRN